MKKILATLLIPLIIVSLNQCAPLAVGAGGVTAGVVGLQERTVGEAVDDTVIWSRVKNQYIQHDINHLLPNISVEVNQGKVLLTGTVSNPELRVEAVRLAWKAKGVKSVLNEVQVASNETLKSKAKDTWITTQVKSKLLLNEHISSVNYSVDTVNGVVYLMGIAKNKRELEETTHIASTIKGVKRVVSHVDLVKN